MDRNKALDGLPTLHAVAVRLRDSGAPQGVIAVAVGLDEDQVDTFLTIADQKLESLEKRPRSSGVASTRPETE